MNIKKALFLLLTVFINLSFAQLKFVIEDFEGYADGSTDLKENGLFTFGNINAAVDSRIHDQNLNKYKDYLGQRALKVEKNGKFDYGGWGKGVGLNVELDPQKDYLNFYVNVNSLNETENDGNQIRIELQEDDNGDNIYQKELDDSWTYTQTISGENTSEKNNNGKERDKKWELISIPLNKFADITTGGDDVFNIDYKHGKLFCLIFSFIYPKGKREHLKKDQIIYFDFICFSKGKLLSGSEISDPPLALKDDFCSLGAWSKEGNYANFTDIGLAFEDNFKPDSEKKLGIVHFFQPFATDGGNKQNNYPSKERINKAINEGYIPMITLENHFVNADPKMKQPNLYSIIEGHFDVFFGDWAKQIKEVNGTVLLRILHEFNGDWYPWCIANNDKNPQLLTKAFRHIHDIFKKENVNNIKFIWCPNSMSLPQEKWNCIMDAYPGDEFVDYVGLDIYNGAGKGSAWRSFRKEGIENYFILTQKVPAKPLFICEVASRERRNTEPEPCQNKEEWIKQMSAALKSDMSKIRLLAWFNEKETFKINSSPGAKDAYLNYIMKDDYFKSGPKYVFPLD